MINYHNKKFRPLTNTTNGETSPATIFEYKQEGDILTASYQGGDILKGHLIGLVDEKGHIQMTYHQINSKKEIMTGVCRSVPELLQNGKIRLHEQWQWTSGDQSKGNSIIEEID